jgi:hypothetical protein
MDWEIPEDSELEYEDGRYTLKDIDLMSLSFTGPDLDETFGFQKGQNGKKTK